MRSDRLFSRDFTLMILGQIISLFGNAILRFALSLYVLDTTGSAAAFGGILAVSMVPTILCSPLGGVLADRVPRQRIMWGLDFFTAALVLGYGLFFASRGTVLAVGVLMVLLAAIQALYQPSVQASIPALASEEHLPAANGVVAQVQALANLLGPILGGMLYGWVGLLPMVAVGGACFFCSAVMELFLRIPFQRRTLAGPPLAALWRDLRDAGRFLTREQPRPAAGAGPGGPAQPLPLRPAGGGSALSGENQPRPVLPALQLCRGRPQPGLHRGRASLWAGAPRRGYPPGLAVSAGHLPAARSPWPWLWRWEFRPWPPMESSWSLFCWAWPAPCCLPSPPRPIFSGPRRPTCWARWPPLWQLFPLVPCLLGRPCTACCSMPFRPTSGWLWRWAWGPACW
ncbi:MAG: MFS transporter [Flavonifractor plautii]